MSLTVIDGVTVLLPPPEGYVVNFAHPQRQADVATYWVAGVENVLAILFLAQRLYTKMFLSGGLGVDDGEFFPRCPLRTVMHFVHFLGFIHSMVPRVSAPLVLTEMCFLASLSLFVLGSYRLYVPFCLASTGNDFELTALT
jgi:hypothetical protein